MEEEILEELMNCKGEKARKSDSFNMCFFKAIGRP